MSSIEDRVAEKLKQRAAAGLAKYGVTMERKDLDFKEWAQHMQEELLDAAVYLERLMTDAWISSDERLPELVPLHYTGVAISEEVLVRTRDGDFLVATLEEVEDKLVWDAGFGYAGVEGSSWKSIE